MTTSVLGQEVRVLIVDDNKDAADMLAVALTLIHGCDTKVAYDGEEGVQVAEGFQPDATILDLDMPHMDGFQAAQILSERTPQMILIAVTGNSSAAARIRGGGCAFNTHMLKPVDIERLAATIHSRLAA